MRHSIIFRLPVQFSFCAMPNDVELLILGGGCAGLSLAMQLAQLGPRAPSTVILERRPVYENDRTWCFWGDDKTPFALQAQHQWSTFKVVNADVVVQVDCAGTPYRMLAAEQFYAAAVAALAAVPQMHLHMKSPVVSEPQFSNGRWHLMTPMGTFSAKMLVDTRPLRITVKENALLWQSFYGFEIESAQPVFEPHCAELMNFSTAKPECVAFTYMLPLSRTRALIEFTVFAVAPVTVEALTVDLENAIAQRLKGAAFTVRRSEQGVLPMGLNSPVGPCSGDEPSCARVGLFAGAARPATGYAFQRIQRWATDCARAIANDRLPIGHPKDPVLQTWMDTLFLKVLRHQPHLAPALFMAMFSQVASRRVIRFLGDGGSLVDYMAMAWALPSRPFLRQLLSSSRWP
jgi:lycopene beta-cyclase